MALLVGIVVPIYNVSQYLRQCLESILNQGYQHFEVILVDDGSTDFSEDNISQSIKIALEFVAKDKRFRLISKENGGISSARNVGIRYFSNVMNNDSAEISHNCKQTPQIKQLLESQNHHINHHKATLKSCDDCDSNADFIKTYIYDDSLNKHITLYYNVKSTCFLQSQIDYIAFLDSDDLWENNLLDECIKALCLHSAEIAWFGFKTHNGAFKNDVLDTFNYKDITTLTPQEWLKTLGKVGVGQFWFSVAGIISFKFLKAIDLHFMESIIHEDELFGVLLFLQSRQIVAIPKKLYIYRIRENSITTFLQSKKHTLPSSLSHLAISFSDTNTAYSYFVASSWCKITIAFLDFIDNYSNKAFANNCKERFLPTFLARSCDIFAFKNDVYALKPRILAILAAYNANSFYVKIIANIIPIHFKQLRYTIFLAYFAPEIVKFRIKKRITSLFFKKGVCG